MAIYQSVEDLDYTHFPSPSGVLLRVEAVQRLGTLATGTGKLQRSLHGRCGRHEENGSADHSGSYIQHIAAAGTSRQPKKGERLP